MGKLYGGLFGVILMALMLASPLVHACFNPSDMYAVEVILNKPGITYNPQASVPSVLTVGNRTFLLRVWNDSEGIHIRVEIPEKRELGAYWSYSGALVLTKNNLSELTKLGWIGTSVTKNGSSVNVFKKGNVTLKIIFPEKECSSDSDCATGGCSGEICAPKEEVEKIVSPCVYAQWYECFRLTSCGCVNGTCSWKPNPAFEKCLKEHGVDPSKVIRAGTARVEATGPNPEELDRALREFFRTVGINCTRFTLISGSNEGPAYSPEEVSAPEVLKAALEELLEEGIIEGLSEKDIEDISRVANWGKAGWNSHIGWYETKNGTYAWIPYDESKDPQLVRCGGSPGAENASTGWVGPPVQSNGSSSGGASPGTGVLNPGSGINMTHENQAAESYEPKTNAGGLRTICGPASLIGLSLIWPMVRKKK
ncbi:CGP-CTERM-anchored Cys-rich protein [Thermococcus gorgonarius]|uniref:Eight-cysteine-cluster domain-containing protein n=1 Tax=Thermococcus gorgonarius TaxID=71997 RepID=A0A2Z2MHR5_THEGO|nr:CGP-CTERM-anchored Cys-rich protein [Thermococcus gorgonarius]ASJ01508.1 hypothetical protein A3K92_08455 [Thermococcus gorgonarius]